MGKKLFSLCMALVLCLSLLPVTALAAEGAPNILYVGNKNVKSGGDITYWSTNDSGELTWVENATDNSDDWNVKYDPNTATLTLNGATINGAHDATSLPYGSGIYALCSSNQSVALTIELIGTNTITGNYGIYVDAQQGEIVGTDASLLIQNSSDYGILEVSGSSHGIYVKSGTGNASLTIKDASVVASCRSSYGGYAGVCVHSGSDATSSPKLSLAVDGGSLTTIASEGNDGIQFYVGAHGVTSETTSLSVTNNAIVDARNGGISASGVSGNPNVDIGSNDNTGGIVFDGKNGTVYGKVKLQEDLEIGEGETLTVGKDASLTVPNGKTLTNNGTVTTEEGGTLTGNITNAPPKITTTSLSEGTVNTAYNQPLAADNNPTSWSVTNGALPNGLTLGNGTISGTPTAAGTYSFTVTATNTGGSDSEQLSITINLAAAVPVESVSLDKTTLGLTKGETARLTATVEPSNATNKSVTWSSDNPSVATVNNGVVSAVSEGTATITVTAQGDSTKSASCTVTVTAAAVPVTGVTLNKTSTSLYVGNTETLTATVAPDNATNKAVTWTSSDSAVATVDQNGVVTAVDRGTATITVTTEDGNYTATCTVTVSRYSSGGGSSSSSTSLSDRAIDDIQDARPGDTVEITLRPGRTTLEREVFEELAGQDITLEIDAGDGVLWIVNGQDIPEDTRLHDLDLDVDLGDSGIPATVLNAVTGEIGTVQLSLAHDGQFGFTMTLSAPLGRDNADYWANLYWYNERTEELEFQQAARIARDGTAEFALDHASDYAIVIDDRSHEPVDLPFNDVPEGYWAYDAIQYVYGEGLMAGTSGSTFSPEGTTTRGQIVTILWRLSGSPVVNYLMDFDDVDPAAYYGEAIRWATSEGIAGGYGGGLFGPDDPITREQLAVMLHRYAQHQGCDVSIGEDTNILSYADAFDVSEYAVSALQWACGAGIISGTGDGSTLTPQGEATRAQAATVLMRFCEEYVTL